MSPLFLIGSLSLKTNVFWVWRGGYHRENYKQEERKSHLVIRELSVLTGLRQLMAWLFVVVCLEKKKCSCELDPSSFWSGVNLTCNQPVLINRFNVLLPCLSYSVCCFPIIVALARHYLGLGNAFQTLLFVLPLIWILSQGQQWQVEKAGSFTVLHLPRSCALCRSYVTVLCIIHSWCYFLLFLPLQEASLLL